VLILAALLALLLVGCTDLAGQPEIVATTPPRSADTIQVDGQTLPVTAPNAANGARIYAENCTTCHNTNGDGMGPLVRDGSVPAMPSFLDATHVGRLTPTDYYEIITNGNLENLMPPWREALTPQERWDVAMYVYTLHYTAAQLAQGEAIFAAECARCHGEQGRGNGPDIVTTGREAYDMSDPVNTVNSGDAPWYISVEEGLGEIMPAYGDTLTEDEMWSVVAYTRSLSLIGLAAAQQADISTLAQSAATPAPDESVVISGQIINGTIDGTVPESLEVTLVYGTPEDVSQQTTTATNGQYRFEDIPVRQGASYFVQTTYRDVIYTSPILISTDLRRENTLPLTLFDQTEDVAVIRVAGVETVIDTLTVENVGTGLFFSQRITFENTSDRAYILRPPNNPERRVSLLVQVPDDALILNEPGRRYIIAQEQFSIIDTAPVLPGLHTIDLQFFMNYEDSLLVQQPFNNPVDGLFSVRVVPPGISLSAEELPRAEDVEMAGFTLKVYQGEIDRAARSTISYALTGNLVDQPQLVGPEVLIIGAIIIILVIVVLLLIARRRGDDAPIDGPAGNREIDQLVQEIAQLDYAHDQGQINHDVYQRQRAELKARLAQLMQQSSEDAT